jgi:hypothetical protein
MICQVSVSIGQSVRVTVFFTNNEWGRFSGLQMLLRSAKCDVQTDGDAESHDAFVRKKRQVVSRDALHARYGNVT